jgi:hypothetical protein
MTVHFAAKGDRPIGTADLVVNGCEYRKLGRLTPEM